MSDTRGYGPAQGGYRAIPEPGVPASTEAWALIEAARRISEASRSPETVEELREALRINWRLWTLFQAQLSLEESGVPDAMRSNMLNLCNFVDKRTVQTLAAPTAEQVKVLIDINRNIASGLMASVEKGAESAAATAPDAGGLAIQSA